MSNIRLVRQPSGEMLVVDEARRAARRLEASRAAIAARNAAMEGKDRFNAFLAQEVVTPDIAAALGAWRRAAMVLCDALADASGEPLGMLADAAVSSDRLEAADFGVKPGADPRFARVVERLNQAAAELGAQCARERSPTIERRIVKRKDNMSTPTSPADRAQHSAAEALARFPGDSIEAKEQRALAAWHVARLKDAFPSVNAVRTHLQELFQVSERQIRRAEKILDYPDIVNRVVRGPVTVTNASHVLEHPGVDMLHIAWACASEEARRDFLHEIGRQAAFTATLEHWVEERGVLLGVVTLDRADQDYGYVVLGRDEHHRFRAIETASSHPSIEKARAALQSAMREIAKSGATTFPQDCLQ
jgi:hypothetical protein